MNRLFLVIGIILTCISAVLLSYTLTLGPLVDHKWADVEWGVVALSPSSNMWASGPVIEHFYFDEGTTIHINFWFGDYSMGGSHIVDFFIADEENYLKWEDQQTAIKFLLTEEADSLDANWTTPHDANWYFVWDTTTYTAVGELRVKLVHYEMLPFGDKIEIDRRPSTLIQILALEIGIVCIGYGLFMKNQTPVTKSSFGL